MLRKFDFWLVIGIVLLQVALVVLGITGIVRAASGFLFIALLPGYSLLAVFYRPYHQDFGMLEQIVLAVPVSLAMSEVIGLLLNTVNLAVQPDAQVLTLGLITGALALFGVLISRSIQPFDRQTQAVLAIVLFCAVTLGVAAQVLAAPAPASYTNLYLLDARGGTTAYPVTASVHKPVDVRVGVTYQGAAAQQFQLVSSTGAHLALDLRPGQTWEQSLPVTLDTPGLQEVSWSLSEQDGHGPQRMVRLWINVK